MHNGSATAVSHTQAMCHACLVSKQGCKVWAHFSAFFGLIMASEAIPGHLIFTFSFGEWGGGGGGHTHRSPYTVKKIRLL